MTTLLPSQDLAMLRAIAKTSAVLLVCLRIDALYPGRAILEREIADILEIDERTVAPKLRSLSTAGMMLAQGNGYVVTIAGRNTLFGFSGQTSLSIEEAKISDEPQILRTQIVLHDDDDIKSVNDSESSSSLSDERKKCAKLLEATDLLFAGGPVNSDGVLHQNPEWVLAWVSKAYVDRRNLRNPQGLVYKRLKDGVRPPLRYLKNAADFLPETYLAEVGLMDMPAVEIIANEFEASDEFDGMGRHRVWLEVVNDAACPNLKGVMFTGNETVRVDGHTLTVGVPDRMMATIAAHDVSATMSRIYAAQCDHADARVVFVSAETLAVSRV